MRDFVRGWLELPLDLKLVAVAQPFYMVGLLGGLFDWYPYTFFLGMAIGLSFGAFSVAVSKVLIHRFTARNTQRMVVCKTCGWYGKAIYTHPNVSMLEEYKGKCPDCNVGIGHMYWGNRFAIEYWGVSYETVKWWQPWTWRKRTYNPPDTSAVRYVAVGIDIISEEVAE